MEAKVALTRSTTRIDSAGIELRIARGLSNLASPPVMGAAMIMVVTRAVPGAESAFWAVASLCACVVAPSAYVGWLLLTRQVSDLHLNQREQRLKPSLFALSCAVLLAGAMWLGSAPILFRQWAGANLALLAAMLIITLRWKISAHCAVAAAVATACGALLGVIAAPTVGLALFVAWSRVRLQRHDVWQCIGGLALGALSAALFFRP